MFCFAGIRDFRFFFQFCFADIRCSQLTDLRSCFTGILKDQMFRIVWNQYRGSADDKDEAMGELGKEANSPPQQINGDLEEHSGTY
ncbi:hypothetical protein C5167_024297 [Papaver somniferum]|uniref:Uncharacterized protein n=1 Tax=Papaver somniferum TaxID=3469 RepID=A0A4Y7JS51_PAPSO|nr:hypothetical protein C5167_024297 [Papaver somniferum]